MAQFGGCLFTAAAAAIAASASAAPPAVTDPGWVEKPTGEQIAAYFPVLGNVLGLSGRTRVSCDVAPSGRLENCKVTEETPKGVGFGAATLAVVPYFRMSPKMVGGRPVAGGNVTVPVAWTFPQSQPPTVKATQFGALPSPGAMELAGKLVDRMNLTGTLEAAARAGAEALRTSDLPGVEPPVRETAAKAIVRSVQIELPLVRDQAARLHAQKFSEAELRQLLAFYDSPLGAKVLQSQGELTQGLLGHLAVANDRMMEEARSQFCAAHDCGQQTLMMFDGEGKQ